MMDNTLRRSTGVVAALVAGAICVGCSAGDRRVPLEMRIVEQAPTDSLTEMSMTVWGGQKTFYAHSAVLLTEEDVSAAMVIKTENGAPAIRLILLGDGREKLLEVTRQNVGRRLGIIVDGRLQCAPLIESPIDDGIILMTGHMLERAAMRCSENLTRGAT